MKSIKVARKICDRKIFFLRYLIVDFGNGFKVGFSRGCFGLLFSEENKQKQFSMKGRYVVEYRIYDYHQSLL
ncbi:MAG: hypothetical protein AAF063_34560 [Cyanobacteria bacterium J06643_5]